MILEKILPAVGRSIANFAAILENGGDRLKMFKRFAKIDAPIFWGSQGVATLLGTQPCSHVRVAVTCPLLVGIRSGFCPPLLVSSYNQFESFNLWDRLIPSHGPVMERYDSPDIINVGCGEDVTIRELAEIILEVVGSDADLVFDARYPDGTPRKLLDTTRLQKLGWKPRISLKDGIRRTYEWFVENIGRSRAESFDAIHNTGGLEAAA